MDIALVKAGKEYPIGWPEIGKVLLWGSLLGFGGRGAVGLYRTAKRRMEEREEGQKGEELKQMMTTPGPDALQAYQSESKLAAYVANPGIKPHPQSREGQGLPPVVADTIDDAAQEASVQPRSQQLKPAAPMIAPAPVGLVGGPMSQSVKSSAEKLAMHPALASLLTIGAGAGGLYGGWELADKLLDSERIKSLDEDIDEAKKQFENTLRQKARLELVVPKTAAFIESMRQSAERGGLQKDAGFLDVLPYFIYTTLAAAVAGEAYKAYKSQAKESPEAVKIEALRNQSRGRSVLPVQARMIKQLGRDELKPVPSIA